MAKNVDMAKLTQRQRRRARDVETDLKDKGVPPRQAEKQAWGPALDYPGRGKRRRDVQEKPGAKTNSSQRGVNRKTTSVKTIEGRAGGPITASKTNAKPQRGKAQGRAEKAR